MSEIKLSSVIGPAFHFLARDVFQHGHTHYDLSGGRGSLKSSCVSLLVPLILIANPGTHAVVLRKVANTIRDSVYAQYLWAIGELGMAAYWDAKVQPMELIYRPTGQKIMSVSYTHLDVYKRQVCTCMQNWRTAVRMENSGRSIA